MKRLGISYDDVDKILITHLHADHGGGIPSLLLEAMIVTRRSAPLTVAGPPGLCEWIEDLQLRMYPGSERLKRRFEFNVVEMSPGRAHRIGALDVTPYPMRHTPETKPTGLRIETSGKVFAYTGDSEWTDDIPALAHGADILVSECYSNTRKVPMHMSYDDILANRGKLGTGKLVLTHAGPDMLEPPTDTAETWARDGMVVAF